MNSCSYVANDISWLLSASLDICVRRVGIEPTTPGFLAPYSTAELPSAYWQGAFFHRIYDKFLYHFSSTFFWLSAPFTRYIFLLQSLSLCPLLFIQQALVNRAKGNQDLLFVSFEFTRRFCTNLRDDKIMHRHSSILCLLLASFNKMWAYA